MNRRLSIIALSPLIFLYCEYIGIYADGDFIRFEDIVPNFSGSIIAKNEDFHQT